MARKIIMHATTAKCFSILGYGNEDMVSNESKNIAKITVIRGRLRYDILTTMIAEAGVVMPTK